MSIATGTSPIQPEPGLLGQTVVVIGGSAGIGLETARRARAEGAKLILAARDPERLEHVVTRTRRSKHRGVRRHRLRSTQKILRRTPDTDRPRAGHRPRSLLRTAGGTRYRKGAPGHRSPSPAAVAGRSLRRKEGSPGRDAALHGRNRWPPHGAGARTHLGAHGRAASPDQEPRARAGARSASTSSPPASSILRFQHPCSAISWMRDASNSARHSRSAAWSAQRTSPPWPSTS